MDRRRDWACPSRPRAGKREEFSGSCRSALFPRAPLSSNYSAWASHGPVNRQDHIQSVGPSPDTGCSAYFNGPVRLITSYRDCRREGVVKRTG